MLEENQRRPVNLEETTLIGKVFPIRCAHRKDPHSPNTKIELLTLIREPRRTGLKRSLRYPLRQDPGLPVENRTRRADSDILELCSGASISATIASIVRSIGRR